MKFLFLIIVLINIAFSNTNKKANSLINEESPYLVQHAYNPVNWYPWNKKVFKLAKKQNKLIFVSIGYSTCHWCHVMEKESFEDKNIAKLLNQDYISIKVDKEELPHIDSTYQDALSKLQKRRNGWPLNFILTPNKKIVYITTYIPNEFKYNTEGMNTLIPEIAKKYKNNELDKIIKTNEKFLNKKEDIISIKDDSSLEKEFIIAMTKRYDKLFFGFDKAT